MCLGYVGENPCLQGNKHSSAGDGLACHQQFTLKLVIGEGACSFYSSGTVPVNLRLFQKIKENVHLKLR